jgi:uncharacterized membrane protein SirB2
MSYDLIKLLHIATVITTFLLFVLRAGWVLRHGRENRPGWMRWVPHLNDTLLLTFGVWLAILASLNPLTHPWLLAKLLALVAYVWLGMLALKRASSRRGQLVSTVLALLVFAYMAGAALTKQAGWPLAILQLGLQADNHAHAFPDPALMLSARLQIEKQPAAYKQGQQ